MRSNTVPHTDLDLGSLRAKTVQTPGGRPGARFSVTLRGMVDVDWIHHLYLLQWQGLDYLDYHLSEDCKEIEFDCENPDEALPVKLDFLRTLLHLVDDSVTTERQIRAA